MDLPTRSTSSPKADRDPNGCDDGLHDLLQEDDAAAEARMIEKLRWREFALIYVAYMGFLACRKNYGLWLPAVVSELGHSKGQAGILGSAMEFTYGTCSFLNGAVIDTYPAKHLLIAGLVLSAVANVCIAGTDSLPMMIALWTANGAVQSVGWPSITTVFLAWFPDPAQRGAWYSLLSTCQNAGAALVPLCVSAFVSTHGWRAALLAPAAATIATALLLAIALHGSPAAAAGTPPSTKAKPTKADLAHSMRQHVFLNHRLWLMAVAYFGVSMVRTCIQDWTSLYLNEAKGMPLATAARCLFLWELGGFGGCARPPWRPRACSRRRCSFPRLARARAHARARTRALARACPRRLPPLSAFPCLLAVHARSPGGGRALGPALPRAARAGRVPELRAACALARVPVVAEQPDASAAQLHVAGRVRFPGTRSPRTLLARGSAALRLVFGGRLRQDDRADRRGVRGLAPGRAAGEMGVGRRAYRPCVRLARFCVCLDATLENDGRHPDRWT